MSSEHRRRRSTAKADPDETSTRTSQQRRSEPLLVEVAWEAVNQLGGIYTVLRSKVPAMDERWGNRYCLVGPLNQATAPVEFEQRTPTGPFGQAVKLMAEWGIEARFGHWLVSGRPRAVLMDLEPERSRLAKIKYDLWQHHDIALPPHDDLMDNVALFGYLVEQFFHALAQREGSRRKIVGHFHEWMGGLAIPELRRSGCPVCTVFTTHATLLGRYLAPNDPRFYDHLPFVNSENDAKRFNIESPVRIERACAHGAHVFTTVSEVTAVEAEHLLGRKPDCVLPNGLNIERFVALHEFQNLHREYRDQIQRFVMGHFFPSYSFDLDNVLFFFTSGRFEYHNKGFDITLEALARLNWRMKQANINKTIVMFIITKRPYRSINADALRTNAVLDELYSACDAIKEQVGRRLFAETAMGRRPKLDDLVEEYWRLRLRRIQAEWMTGRLPLVVTHDLYDDGKDQILNQIRKINLVNHRDDPVKIIYHPDFISPSNPLFGMEYDQFVRGCHLGIFPSYYEPWGYTPLECIARGIPAVTSDLSGFGAYVNRHLPNTEMLGVKVLNRSQTNFDECSHQLAEWLFGFVCFDRRERIAMRNQIENSCEHFDWRNLAQYYDQAHELAMQRV